MTDPTHLHLLLNHFPTIGFIIGLGLFLIALIAKSDDLKQATLAIFVGISILAIPTYVTGNAAYELIRDLPEAKQSIVETHEGAAFLALVVIELVGAVSWLGLWQFRRTRRLPGSTTAVLLALSVVALALVAGAANLGGEIRHTEIRPAVESTTAIGPLARQIGDFVRDTPWAWVSAETLHFVGLSILIGVLLLIAMRMSGLMSGLSTAALDRVLPWGMLGFVINTATGMLFFAASPGQYTQNPAFYWKLVFLLAGGAVVLYFTFDEGWKRQPGQRVPVLSMLTAVAALFLWVGVMYWGSMLPFIGNAF
jgi:uncharacterized membrane protein